MNPCKPLYPPPWWATPELAPSCRPNDSLSFGEEFIVRFVGTDCDGNALYCVRRRAAAVRAAPLRAAAPRLAEPLSLPKRPLAVPKPGRPSRKETV